MRGVIPTIVPTIRRFFLKDYAKPNTFAIRTIEDCDPVLAQANRVRHMTEATPSRLLSKENVSVALIPVTLYWERGMKDWGDAEWRRFLRDPENRKFLTGKATTF